MPKLKGKKILLGISGGIAVYKSASLLRRLTRDLGAEVQVIMTDSAQQFMTPLIFETFSGKKVLTQMFEETNLVSTRHIDLVQESDLFLIIPATLNIIGKVAHGIADDILSTMLSVATPEKVCFAPAMNKNMYSNPAFQQNLAFLKAKAYKIIDAETGALATNIEGEGKGRLADESVILDWIDNYFSQSLPLKGKKVLISAGPTREYIDQLRFISNPSSGKMGIALAEAAKDLGADVHLVYGPGSELPPETINRHDVVTTMDMKNAMLKKYEWADIVIMAAAVEDIKPVSTFKGKLKKESIPNSLALETTEDILLELGMRKKKQLLIGFSVENEDILENSRKKLEKKKLDFIVINNPSEPGAGFGVDTNKVIILDSDNKTIAFPLSTKKDIAKKIMLYIKEKKA